MQVASLQGILKIVLIIFLAYFAFKLAIKWFGPMILRYFVKKMGNKFQDQFNQASHQHRKEQGETTILNKDRSKSKRSKEKVGEYIDYEEID